MSAGVVLLLIIVAKYFSFKFSFKEKKKKKKQRNKIFKKKRGVKLLQAEAAARGAARRHSQPADGRR